MTARPHRLASPAVLLLAAASLAACSQAGADVAVLGPPPAAVSDGTATTAATAPASRPVATAAAAGSCPAPPPPPDEPPPAPLVADLQARLADPRLAGTTVAASIWMAGYGEIVARDPDRELLPASNQKLLTALGVLSVLPPDATFRTRVVATGPLDGGVVRGDLVLVGGGDPTLKATQGLHSLTALTIQLLDAGVHAVTGDVVVDESRYPAERAAPGWRDGDVPESSGPLSALVVDGNVYRSDPAFLADPALGAADLFRQVLTGGGISVSGTVATGTAPPGGRVLASLESPTVNALVSEMLQHSDNEIAELLTREAGRAVSGVGTTQAGTAVLAAALARLCVELPGTWADGSGLSRDDRGSARELRRVLQVAQGTPAWPVIMAGLPVGGRSGTLIHRFGGTAAEGVVRAKTGYLDDAQALSGIVTTAGGRAVVFSILVNGQPTGDTIGAIDDVVVALATDRS